MIRKHDTELVEIEKKVRKRRRLKKGQLIIGWEEWFSFPKLKIPAIKAKVDTGAKTSCLHAFNISTFHRFGRQFVRFAIHPIQRNKKVVRNCTAPVFDYRYFTSSSGKKEKRYVIKSRIHQGLHTWKIEISLAKRDNMAFRMLLGREAMRTGKLVCDPSRSCVRKKLTTSKVKKIYKNI